MPRLKQVSAQKPFELRLLGWWRLTSNGRDIELGHREQRLTAVLALRGARGRSVIAGTLWPDHTEAKARASLRTALLRVQQRAPGLLNVSRSAAGLHHRVSVDVHEFLASAGRLGERPRPESAEAVLATEELLPGWDEDWVLLEREHLQQVRLRALELLAEDALGRRDPGAALLAASEALRVEPLHERAHDLAIRAQLMDGNPSAALRHYQRLHRLMADELGIAPSPHLRDLVAPLLRARRHSEPRPPRPRTPDPAAAVTAHVKR